MVNPDKLLPRWSLSLLATVMIFGGSGLLLWDPRMQIISLIMVFSGLLLACVALALHLRRPQALFDLLLLTSIGLTICQQAALPQPVQDMLFKLGG